MLEPGLDKHEWESRWQQLEEDLGSAPVETLPEMDRLIEEMLRERGHDLENPIAREGEDRDVVVDFLSAREITRAVERGVDGSLGDIPVAVENYRDLYEFLVNERGMP